MRCRLRMIQFLNSSRVRNFDHVHALCPLRIKSAFDSNETIHNCNLKSRLTIHLRWFGIVIDRLLLREWPGSRFTQNLACAERPSDSLDQAHVEVATRPRSALRCTGSQAATGNRSSTLLLFLLCASLYKAIDAMPPWVAEVYACLTIILPASPTTIARRPPIMARTSPALFARARQNHLR